VNKMTTDIILNDIETWRICLNINKEIFSEIKINGKIGILPRNSDGSEGSTIQVWEILEDSIRVSLQPFLGFRDASADLIFLLESSALEEIYRHLKNELLIGLRKQIRHGKALLFLMKGRDYLIDMGYEELIEYLGIPCLGTCH